MFFLQEPPEHEEVRFEVKHVSARTVKEILRLAAVHRAELLVEWERSQVDE